MDAKLKEFLIKVSQDEELKKELLEKLGDDATEATDALRKVALTVAEFAQDKGVDIDFQKVLFNIIKVNDEALDEVAGGRVFLDSNGEMDGDCYCFAGGGGTADEYQKTCACVGVGMGFPTDKGEDWIREHGDATFMPLSCPLVGYAKHHTC